MTKRTRPPTLRVVLPEQDAKPLTELDLVRNRIAGWLAARPEEQREGFSCPQVIEGALGLAGGWGRVVLINVGRALNRLGYYRAQQRIGRRREWRYWRRDSLRRYGVTDDKGDDGSG